MGWEGWRGEVMRTSSRLFKESVGTNDGGLDQLSKRNCVRLYWKVVYWKVDLMGFGILLRYIGRES